MGRSVAAVIVGAVVAIGLAMAGDYLLVVLLAPKPGSAVLANNTYVAYEVVIGFVAGTLGGFGAAMVAGRMPFGHGIGLGVVLLLLSVFYIAAYKNGQPEWYLAMLGMVSLLAASFGGWLCAKLVQRVAATKEAARMQRARA